VSTLFDDTPEPDGTNDGSRLLAGRDERGVSLRDLAGRLAADRVRRGDLFDGSLFSDPAWELLLDIFRDHLKGDESSVREITAMSFLQPQTAIRWLDVLEGQGLVVWCVGAEDVRTHVRLTERGIVGMTCYLHMLAGRWGLRLKDHEAN
jgi:hypothetical protein